MILTSCTGRFTSDEYKVRFFFIFKSFWLFTGSVNIVRQWTTLWFYSIRYKRSQSRLMHIPKNYVQIRCMLLDHNKKVKKRILEIISITSHYLQSKISRLHIFMRMKNIKLVFSEKAAFQRMPIIVYTAVGQILKWASHNH